MSTLAASRAATATLMQPDRAPVDRLVLLKPYAAAAEAAAGPVTLSQLAGEKPCVLHLFTG